MEPERLALRFGELVSVPANLPKRRADWLREVCLDAQDRWRLVRMELDEERAAVRAEVDLSGVPVDWAQGLFEVALAALTCAVERSLASLHLIVNTSVESRALARRLPWGPPLQPKQRN